MLGNPKVDFRGKDMDRGTRLPLDARKVDGINEDQRRKEAYDV